jgi:ligand-binding SRPBCC domain-containing protein
MPVVSVSTMVAAPIELVFDLARSMDLHRISMKSHQEKLVGGVTESLIGPGDTVTFRARHFGWWFELTSQVTAFDRPTFFQDQMTRGPFQLLLHTHHFQSHDGGTLMRDTFEYQAPLGRLGRLAERLFLDRHLAQLLRDRQAAIRAAAESDQWRSLIVEGV